MPLIIKKLKRNLWEVFSLQYLNNRWVDLSVVIVNYKVKDFLRLCLHSVERASENLLVEVFVVDNNSEDGAVDMVREEFSSYHVIANKENVGFAIANNQAIRKSSGEFVLLLNPDTVVANDSFVRVVNFMRANSDAGGVGVRMIDGSGDYLPESKRGLPTPWVSFCKMSGINGLFNKSKLFNEYYKGALDESSTGEIEVMSGACMFMRKEALDKVGLLDEDFFMYGEDIDLSYRIIKGGYKNYYYPETTIVHFKGESTRKNKIYIKRFYKAMIQFAQKHFTKGSGQLMVLFIKLGIGFTQLFTLVNYALKKSSKSDDGKGKSTVYLYHNSQNDSLELSSSSKGFSLKSNETLDVLNSGTLLFAIAEGRFQEYIQVMTKYNSRFIYRFLSTSSNQIIGSDSKETNGVIENV